MKKVLNEELQSAYLAEGGTIDNIRQSSITFEVQAGAKLAERRAMAQALPIMVQYFSQQPVIQALANEGKKISQTSISKMIVESSGWKQYYSIVEDMTPEEKQQAQANQPGAIAQKQAQAQQQIIAQKAQATAQLAEQNNMARAANEVLRRSFETSATPEALTGEPGNTGFGSSL
jgi:hypothetical protein